MTEAKEVPPRCRRGAGVGEDAEPAGEAFWAPGGLIINEESDMTVSPL
jgi:hypothetical protein